MVLYRVASLDIRDKVASEACLVSLNHLEALRWAAQEDLTWEEAKEASMVGSPMELEHKVLADMLLEDLVASIWEEEQEPLLHKARIMDTNNNLHQETPMAQIHLPKARLIKADSEEASRWEEHSLNIRHQHITHSLSSKNSPSLRSPQ